ncbi:hypothetical protein M5C97_23070 [Acidovorax sp. NCPPB 3859]|nr:MULTISPECIES: YiaA/YiaB family inner membrane protein [unclassified Acidovorax]MDA8452818.1 hypothetical protein [Acidovorax sp. GBBC 3297]MDA8462209.1 hypothetical protein [Acidovorax sp. GBBC 3333]MDA8467259.1 hypothetical protein [Acidovorax sp. GBBC 3332]MDA8472294.1 hypothetical protein [Acidovorax sp. GBBC 3299]WCM78339.1 hypothetical protein M5C94_23020 [Acidovorax sp. GBBC 712]
MPRPSASSPASSSTPLVQRDTAAWQLQVWVSFGIAAFCCAVGLAWLPGERLEQIFMVMGYVFCLSAVFMLAKFVRDNQAATRRGAGDTPLFKLVVWGGFAVAVGLTGWGLLDMEISPTYKAFLGVSWLYLLTTAFTLAKMLRDRHEADLAEARLLGRREAMQAPAAASPLPEAPTGEVRPDRAVN